MVTLNAHFDGKTIVPDEPSVLPFRSGVRLRVQVEAVESLATPSRTVGEALDRLAGQARDLPSDLAANHDQYRRERRVP